MNHDSAVPSIDLEGRLAYEAPVLVRQSDWEVVTGSPSTSSWKK